MNKKGKSLLILIVMSCAITGLGGASYVTILKYELELAEAHLKSARTLQECGHIPEAWNEVLAAITNFANSSQTRIAASNEIFAAAPDRSNPQWQPFELLSDRYTQLKEKLRPIQQRVPREGPLPAKGPFSIDQPVKGPPRPFRPAVGAKSGPGGATNPIVPSK